MEGYKESNGVWFQEDTRQELIDVVQKAIKENPNDTYFISLGNTASGAYIKEEKEFTTKIQLSGVGDTGKEMLYIHDAEGNTLWLQSEYVLYMINQTTNKVLYDKREKYSLSISLTIILHLCSCIMVESEVLLFNIGKAQSIRISSAVIRSIISAVKALRVDVKAFKNAISRNNRTKDKRELNSSNEILVDDDNQWSLWFHAALSKMQNDGMRGQEVFGHLLYCYAKGELDNIEIQQPKDEKDEA